MRRRMSLKEALNIPVIRQASSSLYSREAFRHPSVLDPWIFGTCTSVTLHHMSRASKITLAGTSLAAVAIVFFVHYGQQAEKTVTLPIPLYLDILYQGIFRLIFYVQAMHAGVVRDMERQKVKKERQADFEMQRELEGEYRKVQTVHDGGGGGKADAGG